MFSELVAQTRCMPTQKHSKTPLVVEMINVEVDDADTRLRLAYKMLLKAAGHNTVSDQCKPTDRPKEKKDERN